MKFGEIFDSALNRTSEQVKKAAFALGCRQGFWGNDYNTGTEAYSSQFTSSEVTKNRKIFI